MAFAGEPSRTSCEYYQNLEEIHQCGPKGYPLRFGLRLCEKYLRAEPKASPGIQAWFPEVRLCLQEALEEQREEITDCEDLKKRALDSHIPCYVSTGFCELGFGKKLELLKITSGDILKLDIRRLMKRINRACAAVKKEGPASAGPKEEEISESPTSPDQSLSGES